MTQQVSCLLEEFVLDEVDECPSECDEVMLVDAFGNEVCLQVFVLPLPEGDAATECRDATGGQLWLAAIVLARKLLAQPEIVQGQTVLELGGGCGLVAMVASLCGASRVVCTDGNEAACRNIRWNILQNSPCLRRSKDLQQPEIEVEVLRFEDAPQRRKACDQGFDVVLGSDLIYGDWGDLVANAAEALLRPGGQLVLCSGSDRFGIAELEMALLRHGSCLKRTSTSASGSGAPLEMESSLVGVEDDALWLPQRLQLGYLLHTWTKPVAG